MAHATGTEPEKPDGTANQAASEAATWDQVASIRDAKHVEVTGIADDGEDALIATGRLADFRCCFGKVDAEGRIDADAARILNVGKGDAISWIGR